jgi:hypothetical protein
MTTQNLKKLCKIFLSTTVISFLYSYTVALVQKKISFVYFNTTRSQSPLHPHPLSHLQLPRTVKLSINYYLYARYLTDILDRQRK